MVAVMKVDSMHGRRSQRLTMLAFLDLDARVSLGHPRWTI